MVVEANYKDFMNQIGSLEFKEKDKLEALHFGCKSVVDCFKRVKHPKFAKYYFVIDDRTNKVLAPIILQRDGFLIFFVTKDLGKSNTIQFIKDIKRLAKETIERVGPIFVKTIKWYKEAHKLDKLIGFKPYKIMDEYTIYVLERVK